MPQSNRQPALLNLLLGTTLAFGWMPAIATAQPITPDGTTATTINTTGLDTTITNGTAAGSNLFHSFQRFDIPTGGSASFDLVNTPNHDYLQPGHRRQCFQY
jgi:large exoprotein involved in heme utilization and adhesion